MSAHHAGPYSQPASRGVYGTRVPPRTVPGGRASSPRPAVERPGANPPIALLLIGVCMAAISSVVIAPSMPMLEEHFRGAESAGVLVPLIVSVPALAMAAFAPVIGTLVDLFGRRFWIPAGMVLFAFAGMAPMMLESLPAIIFSRVLVGLSTAMIATTCVTLVGDYFTGVRRARYLALLTVCSTIAAFASLEIGRTLASINWKAPYLIFGAGMLILVASAQFRPRAHDAAFRAEAAAEVAEPRTVPPPRLTSLLPIGLLTVVASIVVTLPPIVTRPVMDGTVVTSAGLLVAIAALNTFAAVVGAIAVREVLDARPSRLLATGFGIAALGYLVGAFSESLDDIVVGVVAILGLMLASFGGGVLLPSLLSWCTRDLNYGLRGRGTSVWQCGFFLGQFLTPLLYTAVSDRRDSPFGTLGLLAAVCFVLTVGALVTSARRRPGHASRGRHGGEPTALPAHSAPRSPMPEFSAQGRPMPQLPASEFSMPQSSVPQSPAPQLPVPQSPMPQLPVPERFQIADRPAPGSWNDQSAGRGW